MSSRADRDRAQHGRAGEPAMLGGGEHGRHDHRARMDRAALEGVVEILAMGRRAVDQRCVIGAEPPLMADRGRTGRRDARREPAAAGHSPCRGRQRRGRRRRAAGSGRRRARPHAAGRRPCELQRRARAATGRRHATAAACRFTVALAGASSRALAERRELERADGEGDRGEQKADAIGSSRKISGRRRKASSERR